MQPGAGQAPAASQPGPWLDLDPGINTAKAAGAGHGPRDRAPTRQTPESDPVHRRPARLGPFDALDGDRAFFLGACAPCGLGTSSITRTVDGGKTWQPQYPTLALEPAQAVVMVNDHIGYGLGTRGDPTVLLQTKDGGGTWQVTAHLPADMRRYRYDLAGHALSFPTEQQGWAIAPGGPLMHTTDGGATWSQAHLPDGVSGITGVAFTSATTGYIAAKEWYFATTDGGTTWQETGGIDWTKATQGHKRQTADGPIISIAFATPERGMAVTMDGRFLRTTDGGATWH